MIKLELIGRLGSDATVKEIGNNQVIEFSIAFSDTFTKNNEKVTNTTWYSCSRWGNNVKIAPYLKKGGLVFVSGKPANRSYIDANGVAQTVNGINVFEIELLGNPSENNQQNPAPQPTQRPQANVPNSFVDATDEPDDLPF